MEEGALTAKKAQDEDIVFAAQLEDEQITANNVNGKVEERKTSPPKLKSSVDDRELLMHTTQQEPDEDSLGWGWLLVGAAVIGLVSQRSTASSAGPKNFSYGIFVQYCRFCTVIEVLNF